MSVHLPKFEHIDHTADVGIKIYGATLPRLFEHAALGLFDIIANLDRVKTDLERTVSVKASDREDLLVRWLSELNYLFFTEREIYKQFKVESISDQAVSARVSGEQLDHDRHEIFTEVKAVTYHHLYITEGSEGWEAQVIFDL
jgi:SHS2 domain-containing protein